MTIEEAIKQECDEDEVFVECPQKKCPKEVLICYSAYTDVYSRKGFVVIDHKLYVAYEYKSTHIV